MSTKPILVVMAAGMGSRYGGLKQIDPVGPSGEAILDYSLYDARRAGFKTVVFIIKHEIEQAFKEAVGARAVRAGFEVRYAYQQLEKLPEGFTVPEGRVKPWGTAHAILVAEEAIGDAPFAVINADDYYGPQGFKLIYDYLSTHADGDRYAWAMVGFLLGNTVSESVSCGIMLAFAAVCLSQLGKRPGAGLLAAVLAIVGIGLPVSYFYSFFRSVSRQIKQMHLPRAFYRVELADTGIAVWMYGQQDKPEPTSRHAWDSFYCAYRTDNAVYLYVEKEKAYLLNDRMEVVWKFLAGILPKEKLHDCRKG